MDDSVRYAFCLEMATLAKGYNDLDTMNEWYSRAWFYLHKASDDGVKLEGFKIIRDQTNG